MKHLRLSLGLTQRQVALRAGCSVTWLQQLEGGLLPRRGAVLERVISVLTETDEPSGETGA